MKLEDAKSVEIWMRQVDNDLQVLALAIKQMAAGEPAAAAQTAQTVLDRTRPK